MPKGHIDYGHMVEQALRGVVHEVLGRLASHGIPQPHHFYITFRTNAPGVEIADFLRERYPNEMTIVLQYQYWDLAVDEEGLAVTLSFNDVPQRLRIPYLAIKVFADPGAEFGLQFTLEHEGEVVELAERQQGSEGAVAATPQLLPKPSDNEAAEDRPPPPEGGAEIVTLDRFRKK